MESESTQKHLDDLRASRNEMEPDLTLGFLRGTFKRDVERPHKQLAAMVSLWAELVPVDIARHTRLEALSRGVLRVVAESSVWHYELDRLLRQGLREQLITRHKGPAFHRVQIRVDATSFRE